jgi:hypothetical protein
MKVAEMMLALVIGACAQNPIAPSGAGNRLNQTVSRALWWYHYWNTAEVPLFHSSVDAKAVRFTDRWVIVIASLKVAIAAGVNRDGTVGPLVSVDESPLYGRSNTSAIEQYERLFLQPQHEPGCVSVQIGRAQPNSLAGQTDRVPSSRGCVDAPKRISGYCQSIAVDLQAAARAVVAKEQKDVIAVVRGWAHRHYPGLTIKSEIPTYSNDDPAVFVFMRCGNNQVQGILIVQREFNGQLIAGKFLDRPDSIRHYVDKIRRLRSTEVEWAQTGP